MDLLGGYGSDGDSSDEETAVQAVIPPTASLVKDGKRRGSSGVESKKGKRIVSLHSVLPRHIAEQLTRSSGADVDSDDEEENRPTPKKSMATRNESRDAELASLLSDLHAAPTTNLLLKPAVSNKEAQPPTRLGLDLLRVETKTTTTTTAAGATTTTTTTTSGAQQTRNAPKPKQASPCGTHDDSPLVGTGRHLKRPKINAAPRVTVVASRSSEGTTGQGGEKDLVVGPAALGVNNSQTRPVGYVDDDDNDNKLVDSRRAKKRSRQEMEKALRAGNFSALDGYTTQSIQPAANVYMAPQEESAAATGLGIRVAPVRMYDTKAGGDVIGAKISGKAKSKNQINFLMASAAAFEMNQSQAQRLKSHRVSAKRKYGW